MSTAEPNDPTATAVTAELEERVLTDAELAKLKGDLSSQDLVMRLRDGRTVVRANAARGLGVVGFGGRDLIPFLRDSEPEVARAAGEALVKLGIAQREHLAAIASALVGARPEVVDLVVRMFAELIGKADAEVVAVLDTADRDAARAVAQASEGAGTRGLELMLKAARDERVLVRLNAVRAVGVMAYLDPPSSIEVLQQCASEDDASDVRATALIALAAYVARARRAAAAKAGEPVPSKVPQLLERTLTPDELKTAATDATFDELMAALDDARAEIRLNAVRVLALQAAAAAPAAPVLGLATRDPDTKVRREGVAALATLGKAGVGVTPWLVRALGDIDLMVVAAAESSLAALGPAAASALVDGLDVSNEQHGARVAKLIGRLPDGADRLRDALGSTSVDVRIHAAIGLGALGKDRAGSVLAALSAATRGGNARVRAAVAAAVAQIDPRPLHIPEPIDVDGFEDRVLTEAELARGKDAIAAAGLANLVPRLGDARVAVRANTALALGVLGGDVAGLADALTVCLRDDEPEVRVGAARALGRLGALAVAACAGDVVRALGGARSPLAGLLLDLIRANPHAAIGAALVRGLETSDDGLARTLCELICARTDAAELLCQAFERPGAQATAARGFVLLGRDRLGPGRAVLERARTALEANVRILATATLLAIDPRPELTLAPLPIDGFDDRVLSEQELVKQQGAITAAGLVGLVPRLADVRPAVRANAALALGVLGGDATRLTDALAVCLRDDDEAVQLSAARAIARLGEPAVIACAADVVRALTDADAPTAALLVDLVRKHPHPAVGAALVRGLDTPYDALARQLLELVCARPDAADLLAQAFERPGAQARAAQGFAMLGKDRLGKGRALLERARIAQEGHVRSLATATLRAIDGEPEPVPVPNIAGFETTILERGALSGSHEVGPLTALLSDGRAVVRANAATALGGQGARGAASALTIAALLHDDDARVRIAAAQALDQLGDTVVVAVASHLVRALGGDAKLAEVCGGILAARKGLVDAALVEGLDTVDPTHGARVAELLAALPNGRELLFAAFDGEAQNSQVNAAIGIGKLGAKRAGAEGRRRLQSAVPGPLTRRRAAALAALAMLGPDPGR